MLNRDASNGGASDTTAKVGQGSQDSQLNPAWFVVGHLNHEVTDLLRQKRSAMFSSVRSIILADNELPMRVQNRVRHDDASDFREQSAADDLAFVGQPPALIVGEPQTFEASCSRRTLFSSLEILEHSYLLVIYPPRKRYELRLKSDRKIRRRENVAGEPKSDASNPPMT